MSFTKNYLSKTPIEDNVFKVVAMAKEAKSIYGDNCVVDATIGSLYDEDGFLVAFNSVYDNFNKLPNTLKASYAESFRGNTDYLETVNDWLLKDIDTKLKYQSIATIGGSGACSLTMSTMLEENQTIIAPNIAWGSYKLMAKEYNLNYATYNLIKNDKFDIDSFKEVIDLELVKSDKVIIIINDPCHNPTGLSMGKAMWQEVVAYLNSISNDKSIILLNDIAYIDYSYDLANSRKYLESLNNINHNILVVIAFSLSKTLTSYGMRSGALVVLHQDENTLQEIMVVLEKACRSIWSNIPNGAMKNFSTLISNNKQAYLDEKDKYIKLLKMRSDIFIDEASSCGLKHYHYDEGFFITLLIDNSLRDKFHEALIKENIFTVKVNMGIRIAICSLSVEKTKGLAMKIKKVLDSIM